MSRESCSVTPIRGMALPGSALCGSWIHRAMFFRGIAEEACDVGPGTNMQQGRTNVAGCIDDAGNQMAAAAAILLDQNHPALGIAGKVRGAVF